MVLQTQIIDPKNKNGLKINGEGEMNVVVHPHPPLDEVTNALPFRQFFTDDGASTGSNDMRVNGATTNVEFYIKAQSNIDIYIKTISVILADASAVLNKYGNLTALTNGVEFYHEAQDSGTTTIADGIKTNLEFIRLGLSTIGTGDGTSAFRADTSGGGADAYLPIIDLSFTFGLPWGLRLRKGTKDKLVFKVKDNLSTGLDEHNIIGYGIKI